MRTMDFYLLNALMNAEKNGKTPLIIDPAGERIEPKLLGGKNIHIKANEDGKLQPLMIPAMKTNDIQFPIKHIENNILFTQDNESWAFYELTGNESYRKGDETENE